MSWINQMNLSVKEIGKIHVPQPPLLSGWKKAKRSGNLIEFKNNKHLLFSFQSQCPEAMVNRVSKCKSFHPSKVGRNTNCTSSPIHVHQECLGACHPPGTGPQFRVWRKEVCRTWCLAPWDEISSPIAWVPLGEAAAHGRANEESL